jgi:hypothetical protein
VRREDLLKPDSMSEVILQGFGALIRDLVADPCRSMDASAGASLN